MVDKVTELSQRISTGGRLYRDARERAERVDDEEAYEDAPEEQERPTPPPPPPVMTTVRPLPELPKPPRDWRGLHSTLLELAGIGVLTTGFSMLALWLGLVVLGVCLMVLGIAVGLPDNWVAPWHKGPRA